MPEFWENDAVATSDSDWWKQDAVKPSTQTATTAPAPPEINHTAQMAENLARGPYTQKGITLPELERPVEPLPGGESKENIAAIESEIAQEDSTGLLVPGRPQTALEWFRNTDFAKRLLGPTEAERTQFLEGAKPYASPMELAHMAVKATQIPEPFQEALVNTGGSVGAIFGEKGKAAGEAIGGTVASLPVAFPALGPVGSRVAAAAFTADMVSQVPELKTQYDLAVRQGDGEAALKLQIQALGTLGFAGLAAKHAATPLKVAADVAAENGAPATAEAVRAQAETVKESLIVEPKAAAPETIQPAESDLESKTSELFKNAGERLSEAATKPKGVGDTIASVFKGVLDAVPTRWFLNFDTPRKPISDFGRKSLAEFLGAAAEKHPVFSEARDMIESMQVPAMWLGGRGELSTTPSGAAAGMMASFPVIRVAPTGVPARVLVHESSHLYYEMMPKEFRTAWESLFSTDSLAEIYLKQGGSDKAVESRLRNLDEQYAQNGLKAAPVEMFAISVEAADALRVNGKLSDPSISYYIKPDEGLIDAVSKLFKPKEQNVAVSTSATQPQGTAGAVEPKIIGMGGAIPAEFEPGRGTATGIKNAQVDKERQARGQQPIFGPTRQSTEAVWDRVMAKIDTDPGWQDRLLDEVSAKPRPLTPDETLALDHRYVDLQNEYAKATRDGAQHYADKYEYGIQEAKERAAFFESKLNELEQVAKTVGTESGRSLQMRRQMIKEDFTLAAMESKARASKGFEPLTEQEHAEIAELHGKLAEAEKLAEESERKSSERIAILEAQKALAEAKASVPEFAPSVLAHAQRFVEFMHTKGDAARSRLRERLGRTSAGVDPLILSDVAIIGAEHLSAKALDLAKFTDALARDVGEWVREHAQEIFDASKKALTESENSFFKSTDKATTEKVRRAITDTIGRTTDIKASIKEKAAKGDGPPLHSDVQKLVRLLVEQNPKITRDGLIDAVHEILKEALPDITRLEAMDAISGRGKFWTPSQDAVSKQIRDLNAQIRLVGHQIDVEAGRPMPRTGYQPEPLSEAAKAENKKLHELMKQYGVVVTDPTAQLGSILQSLKTRLQSEKAELERRIANKDFSPRKKTRDLPLDPEAAQAKAEVTILRDRFARMLSANNYALKSKAEKAWINLKEGLNISRSIKTAFDVSAVGRQGWFIGAGNWLRAGRSIIPMFRAMKSEKVAVAIEEQILSRKNSTDGTYARAKLFIAPRNGKLSGMEEATMSKFASRIPGVAGSQRAYVTFLNLLRADTFDALHDNLIDPTWFQRTVLRKTAETPSDAQLQAIGTYINEATGRGSLGKANIAAETLATVFFSPRFTASRFQLLVAHSAWKGDSFTRYLIAREYGKTLIGLGVVYGLANLAGASIETDRKSTDFGKIKFGNSRIDPMAGLSQTTVFLTRFFFGEGEDGGGKAFKSRSSETLINFLRNKLSPVVGSALDVRDVLNDQKPPPGHPQTLGAIALDTVIPLTFGDIAKIMDEHGLAAGTIFEILNLFGWSVQNYQSGAKPKK